MNVQRLRDYIQPRWKILAAYAVVVALLGFALGWQLGSLPGGYSSAEVNVYQSSLQFFHPKMFLENPLNAPFMVGVRALQYVFPHHLIVVRLVSVFIGVVALAAFTLLLRSWQGKRTAIFGALLFGFSAWFLHTARLGTPDVLLFGVGILFAAGYWLKTTMSWLALLACVLSSLTLLYVPGMVWFVALGVLWQWKVIDRAFKKHLIITSAAGVLFLAVLAPLAWALYKHHALLITWAGLPSQWPTLIEIAKNVVAVPFHLFVHNEVDPMTWLGTSAIFDVCSLVLFILGGYDYLRRIKLIRTPLFISAIVLAIALIAVGGNVTFTVIIPLLYVVIAGGASRLIEQWFAVFPRNPIARSIGWASVSVLVGLACAYQLTHYFVGWPQASATRDTFTVKKL